MGSWKFVLVMVLFPDPLRPMMKFVISGLISIAAMIRLDRDMSPTRLHNGSRDAAGVGADREMAERHAQIQTSKRA
ncbi:hypothetical protein GGTG_04754 [Gaeumannomyces tritici R3-111a-1]|uniref:Uncharacterized protein n=1 Tax=Gaeumannomyces tritici (strain R3-111a-1) TaxID=644352 RepID=J3NU05_GAET3|nr:hypothetical protein GGTG_04754 [Gaeumannomyces tritici R3-111a-1]EJT79670.1 hypothetical protein GGTG_04754 [Gaeumannomyces tritici R3-111a-1]